MANTTGLQRSAVSFRRQGSSGLVWQDGFFSGELNRRNKPDRQFFSGEFPAKEDGIKIDSIRTARSGGATVAFALRRESQAAEPPSPRVSACGCCGKFGPKTTNTGRARPTRPRRR